ncbi:hypothetical protein, partial [Capnocytophaga sputigena]|uniref:hypothetical protein n=1 Tax=Capnocytophaga sputigena TaxID=1019 RepID=UPI0028D90BD3
CFLLVISRLHSPPLLLCGSTQKSSANPIPPLLEAISPNKKNNKCAPRATISIGTARVLQING